MNRRPLAPVLVMAVLIACTFLVSIGRPVTAAAAAHRGAVVDVKRGVASDRYLVHDPAKLRRLGATWAYNWSASPPASEAGLEWVPMLWGPGSMTPQTLALLRREGQEGRVHELLGFNEPDSAPQSNLSPVRAAALWPELERTGLRLGSPAPAVAQDGWLARFMALARTRHLRVDFIALHVYQDYTNPAAVSDLRSQLVALHNEYRRPLWITEIGALDIAAWGEPMDHRASAALAVAYMRRLFTMLDGLVFVQRYAWFTDGCTSDPGCRASSLFDAAGRVTAAGKVFESSRPR
jgi:hypothetical protein